MSGQRQQGRQAEGWGGNGRSPWRQLRKSLCLWTEAGRAAVFPFVESTGMTGRTPALSVTIRSPGILEHCCPCGPLSTPGQPLPHLSPFLVLPWAPHICRVPICASPIRGAYLGSGLAAELGTVVISHRTTGRADQGGPLIGERISR